MEWEDEEKIPDAFMNEYGTPTLDTQIDRLVFQPQVKRSKRTRKPMLLLENGSDPEEILEESDGPLSSKHARTVDDDLIAETGFAYAVSVSVE
ncbi:uncharacterized protein PHALS_10085 [Plasmopara halstedii]|uniref:Uncharacterized protein n=1 Tax=Plasmopara halstedii TaxID=4781 RepID=A0A0P1AG93_PLAHL|nr:uncharacterized protein PHALS_10085 [Plasmopara halstedii]CEG39854.1 hypothetical protein PHALS_10085 [Plasmopara halstedii]|eukprot:XP_024576223.1 hypothetical protein PHALS_10085 [Plasmopara halstedii]